MKSVAAGLATVSASGTVWGKIAWADSAASAGPNDLALVNGHIMTMDPTNPVVSTAGIRNGRFSHVGHAETLGPCVQTINLRGATVIPGLIDSHVAYIRCGLDSRARRGSWS
jgi:predicted amidohydrolase YtcJ